jgi:hypothetical protein
VGTIFTLTDDIREIAQNCLDDLLEELGKECRLVFPPRLTECVNCLTRLDGQSAAVYRPGGPQPFSDGDLCPVCLGQGFTSEEVTEAVKMLVQWAPEKFWVRLPPQLQLPAGSVQTKTYITNLPKIQQARRMVLQTPAEPYTRFLFRLEGEPVDVSNIIQGRYCVSTWAREG